MERKFTALRTISLILKIIAWIVAALTVIGFFAMLVGGVALSQFGSRYGGGPFPFGAFGGFAMAFYILILGGIWFITLLAWAYLIEVALAIEENTRALKPKV